MRSHSALYVDAGYLVAAAATRATGSSYRRGVNLDYGKLITELIALVEHHSGLPLLRVYWYDAAHNAIPTTEQEKIAALPKVKLRLGRIGVEGEQKGVDLRIGLDIVGHARNGAVDMAYLLSGDDDLTEAVEEAQAQGVQVTVLAVPATNGLSHGVSRHLLRAVDGVDILSGSLFDANVVPVGQTTDSVVAETSEPAVVHKAPSPVDLARRVAGGASASSTTAYSGATGVGAYVAPEYNLDRTELEDLLGRVVDHAYEAWSATATPEQRQELLADRPSIPRDLDRALLVDLSAAINVYDLSDRVRVRLRGRFWEAVDRS